MVAAIERGYPQREISEASYRYQVEVDKKEKIIVGVNDFVTKGKPLDTLQIDETVAHRQAERLSKLRAERSSDERSRRLSASRKPPPPTHTLTPHPFHSLQSSP